jgi:hypothetical protein
MTVYTLKSGRSLAPGSPPEKIHPRTAGEVPPALFLVSRNGCEFRPHKTASFLVSKDLADVPFITGHSDKRDQLPELNAQCGT